MFACPPFFVPEFQSFLSARATRITRSAGLALILGALGWATARAGDVLPPDQALQKATQRLESAVMAQPKTLHFALTTRVQSTGDDIFTAQYRYDPGQPEGQQWILIHPSESEDAKGREKLIKAHEKQLREAASSKQAIQTPDQEVLVRHVHEMAKQDARFLREDGNSYVFSFDPGRNLPGKPGGQSKQGNNKRQQKMKDAFRGEFAISRDGRQFLWMRLFTVHSFKPAKVAKIKQFEVKTQFAPAWPGGPLVQVRQENRVRGSALFHKFDQHNIMTYSGFEKR